MINKYEARLGTERMLPLVFKMALPAVVAQFVNLLYSMVDRIYIGHIPGIGTDALAGVGVTTSLVILISSFSAIVGGGGAPLASHWSHWDRADRLRLAGKIFGEWFCLINTIHPVHFVHRIYLYGTDFAFYGCFGKYVGICG